MEDGYHRTYSPTGYWAHIAESRRIEDSLKSGEATRQYLLQSERPTFSASPLPLCSSNSDDTASYDVIE
jgi:hypothetical protein